jgi:hypothetical protein
MIEGHGRLRAKCSMLSNYVGPWRHNRYSLRIAQSEEENRHAIAKFFRARRVWCGKAVPEWKTAGAIKSWMALIPGTPNECWEQ